MQDKIRGSYIGPQSEEVVHVRGVLAHKPRINKGLCKNETRSRV
jgi:hypothetical protein